MKRYLDLEKNYDFWSEMKKDAMVAIRHSSPCLFYNSSQYYSNRNAKAKAFKEIASKIIENNCFL